GGRVMLGWTASKLDGPAGTVTSYRVWRRLPLLSQASAELSSTSRAPGEIRTLGVGPLATYWEALATLPASGLSGYAYVAATLQDSLPGSNPSTAFFVSALTADPGLFYDSNVDSGYSVDNLPPDVPQGLQGADLAGGGIKLKWLPSHAPDLSVYRVYRGSLESFVPSAANRIGTTTDTTLIDGSAAAFYSKLSAVDRPPNST